MIIRLGTPVRAARNIGPVSFPITNAAPLSNRANPARFVFPHKSIASGEAAKTAFTASRSSAVPTSTISNPRAASSLPIAANLSAGHRFCGFANEHPGIRTAYGLSLIITAGSSVCAAPLTSHDISGLCTIPPAILALVTIRSRLFTPVKSGSGSEQPEAVPIQRVFDGAKCEK